MTPTVGMFVGDGVIMPLLMRNRFHAGGRARAVPDGPVRNLLSLEGRRHRAQLQDGEHTPPRHLGLTASAFPRACLFGTGGLQPIACVSVLNLMIRQQAERSSKNI